MTPRQQQVLATITRLTAANKRPPTVRELGAAIGTTSPNAVTRHLRALRAEGFVLPNDGHPGIRLVVHDRCPLCGSVP